MAFMRRPNHWLCCAVFAAAFWITLRVMAAPAAAVPPNPAAAAGLAEVAGDEIRDPVLERMIARFAREATQAQLRQNGR